MADPVSQNSVYVVDLRASVGLQTDVVLLHPFKVFTVSGDLKCTHDIINVPH